MFKFEEFMRFLRNCGVYLDFLLLQLIQLFNIKKF